MLTFLSGTDIYRLAERRKKFIRDFQSQHENSDVFSYDFSERNDPEYVRSAMTHYGGGLFGGTNLLVWTHIELLSDEAGRALETFLVGHGTDGTYLVIEYGKPLKKRPLSKFLLEEKTVQRELFSGEGESLSRRDIREQLSARYPDTRIADDALSLLLASLGKDEPQLLLEIEKLGSFRSGETISKEDVGLFLGTHQESAVFEALDALARDDKARALFLFERELSLGGTDAVFQLLALCAWQVRQCLLIREAYEHGNQTREALIRATKLSPFVVGKLFRVIAAFPLRRLRRSLSLLADIDRDMKTSSVDGATALSMFVMRF